MNRTIKTVLAVAVLVVLAAFVAKTCSKETPNTTKVVENKEVDNGPSQPTVPSPELLDFDTLIAKGVQVDSLRKVLKHVTSRYTYYKQETQRLRSELDDMTTQLATSPDCAGREEILHRQIAAMQRKVNASDALIDSLFASLGDARKVNTYTFEEQSQYEERTTEVTVVGWLPEGGYHVASSKYIIPETTITKHTSTPMMPLALLHGGLGIGANGRQVVAGGYARRVFGRIYFGADATYEPSTSEANVFGRLVLPMGRGR